MKKIYFNFALYSLVLLIGTGCSEKQDESDDEDPIIEQLEGKFVFVSWDDGDGDIYTVNADGTGILALTTNNINDVQPSCSPDGSKIAYNTYGYQVQSEIMVMNNDGSNKFQITHDAEGHNIEEDWPTWSANGSILAFETYRDATIQSNGTTIINADIYTANANGSGGDAGLTDHLFYDGNPSWSPDGSKIAFVHAETYESDGHLYSTGYQIWVMNSNGTGWDQLTTEGSNNLRPKWSPDGTEIVYQSDEGLCKVDLSGNYEVLLNYGDYPSWSPDGTKIVFDFQDDIYIMNPDGSNPKKVPISVGARQVIWVE